LVFDSDSGSSYLRPYASETGVEHARPFCREASNGFEGAFEVLENQATGVAGGI
jgi:hypothetical protein